MGYAGQVVIVVRVFVVLSIRASTKPFAVLTIMHASLRAAGVLTLPSALEVQQFALVRWSRHPGYENKSTRVRLRCYGLKLLGLFQPIFGICNVK